MVCRHLLHGLKKAFPAGRVTFVAPGERGRLFGLFGVADATADWENAAFAWLFSDAAAAASPPPLFLRTLFAPETAVFAYLDLHAEAETAFRRRLALLEPTLRLTLSPSRPPDGANRYIGEWLIPPFPEAAAPFDPEGGALMTDAVAEPETLILHPGSGSTKKNWPPRSFAALAEELRPRRIRILAGEADGAPGEELAALLPGADVVRQPSLRELTNLLASAGQYIGNDSGVTHLAAAARRKNGDRPNVAAVFLSSDPGIWAAPDTLVLDGAATPAAAAKKIRAAQRFILTNPCGTPY